MTVRIISVTPDAEKTIAYCARVSSPQNRDNSAEKLLAYCIRHSHWSVFEMANMIVEIVTSRAISAQILRHRSFSFQEFSQRYAPVSETLLHRARSQDPSNRQHSIDDLPGSTQEWWEDTQKDLFESAHSKYQAALERGIAKECARFILPMASSTTLYMNGTVRSWIHYIQLRTGHGTQKEHQDIAVECRDLFVQQFPLISTALGWGLNM